MLPKLRKRYGAAGLVAVLALIVAVAFAGVPAVAQPVATTSASLVKQVKKALGLSRKANARSVKAIKIARASSGPEGPAGPAGTNGTNGTNGEKGATGAEGPEGSPWTAGGTLPSGETLTGAWRLDLPGGGTGFVPISFPIPLAAALNGEGCRIEEGEHIGTCETHYINPAGEERVGIEEMEPQDCGKGIGSEVNAANPQANPGHLCVYATWARNLGFIDGADIRPVSDDETSLAGADTAGAVLKYISTGSNARSWGTFAVTAP